MKKSFTGYYSPNEDEFARLWKDGLIVIDTNILLSLYRLPKKAREESLSLLNKMKEKLWIPHQVALEFQRNRLTVIEGERLSTEKVLNDTKQSVNSIKKRIEDLEMDKRGLDLLTQPLLDDYEKVNQALVNAIEKIHESLLDISSVDPIRNEIDNLFDGRVGGAPKDQSELDELFKRGEERYKQRIPPGYEDASKEKNLNDATFVFDHIVYQKKFGDLILWNQLIEHARKQKIKAVILVTQDVKEDWWWREKGKTIGPHSELMSEIKRESGVELFWMYSWPNFIEHANKNFENTVSTESVEDIQQLSKSIDYERDLIGDYIDFVHKSNLERMLTIKTDSISNIGNHLELRVMRWIQENICPVKLNEIGFPHFISVDEQVSAGYHVIFVSDIFEAIEHDSHIEFTLSKAFQELMNGSIKSFSLIVAITSQAEPVAIRKLESFRNYFRSIMIENRCSSIIFGSINEFNSFTLYDFLSTNQLERLAWLGKRE
ncbi:PIN-like domain-containing protein [Ampullimonas aquatilis]|uniref:PIN-like domain-containing protein n=1 Tax=Ampullimonas aquatilis TaxID=1341549 RepID=UPI003C724DA2